MLTSCIISEAFLPSSIRETTCFSSLFLYLHLNTLIMPGQVAVIEKFCDRVILAKRSASCFLNYSAVIQGGKARYREREWSFYVLAVLYKQEVSVRFHYFSCHPSLFIWEVMYHTLFSFVLIVLKTSWWFTLQIITGSEVTKTIGCYKKGCCKKLFRLFSTFTSSQFLTRPFSGKALKNKPSLSMF